MRISYQEFGTNVENLLAIEYLPFDEIFGPWLSTLFYQQIPRIIRRNKQIKI